MKDFLHYLAVQPGRLWRYLGLFQSPGLRLVHAMVVGFIVMQLLSSVPMDIGERHASFWGWYHMWGGAGMCLLAIIQVIYSFRTRGLRHFYPYLWGDLEALKKDIQQSLRFKLVPPRSKGLGAVVQGLGLGAIVLTAFSGLYWFWLWQAGLPQEQGAREFHDAVSWLIILYFIGHGGMATLHLITWEGKVKQDDSKDIGLAT